MGLFGFGRDAQADVERDWRISILERQVRILSLNQIRMEREMAKDKDALAQLDAELDALEQYIKSDEETDAAEVQARTERVRQILASAQGSGEVAPEQAAEVEEKLAEVTAPVQDGGQDAPAAE